MYEEKLKKLISNVDDSNLKEELLSFLPNKNFVFKFLKVDISEEEYNSTLDRICEAFLKRIFEKYPHKFFNDGTINSKLSIAINRLYLLDSKVVITDSNFKYYPVEMSKEKSFLLYTECLKHIIIKHLETGMSIEELMTSQIDFYTNKLAEKLALLNKKEMLPYYGSPKFLMERSKYVLECARRLDVDISELESVVSNIINLYNKYPSIDETYREVYPYFDEKYKENYTNLETNYLRLLQIENELSLIVHQEWIKFLTNPNNHNDSSFKYLIHVFTQGLVPLEKISKTCTALVTENLLTIPYGNSGIICYFDIGSVDSICTEDADSWVETKKDFMEALLPCGMQLNNPSGMSISYENPKFSKLVLPKDLEREAIVHNLKCNNNQFLTYDNCCYSEILLSKNVKVIGAFYTDDCKDITEIREYSKRYNLPLIHLSLEKLRLLYSEKAFSVQNRESVVNYVEMTQKRI